MPEVGIPELLIIGVIVLLIFGPGKVSDIGGALGRGIREFRKASSEDTDTASSVAAQRCSGCTATIGDSQRFCSACGAPVSPPLGVGN